MELHNINAIPYLRYLSRSTLCMQSCSLGVSETSIHYAFGGGVMCTTLREEVQCMINPFLRNLADAKQSWFSFLFWVKLLFCFRCCSCRYFYSSPNGKVSVRSPDQRNISLLFITRFFEDLSPPKVGKQPCILFVIQSLLKVHLCHTLF